MTTLAGMRTFPEDLSSFTDLLEIKHRWPEKGDRLLKSGADWNTSAGFSAIN